MDEYRRSHVYSFELKVCRTSNTKSLLPTYMSDKEIKLLLIQLIKQVSNKT